MLFQVSRKYSNDKHYVSAFEKMMQYDLMHMLQHHGKE